MKKLLRRYIHPSFYSQDADANLRLFKRFFCNVLFLNLDFGGDGMWEKQMIMRRSQDSCERDLAEKWSVWNPVKRSLEFPRFILAL